MKYNAAHEWEYYGLQQKLNIVMALSCAGLRESLSSFFPGWDLLN